MNLPRTALLIAFLVSLSSLSYTQSIFTSVPEDRLAVTLDRSSGAFADGIHDDSDALQQAINRVQETVHHGIVFIPEGRYRLTRIIHIWSGIRLIGCGKERPIFLLAENTPGFQNGSDKYMLWFTDERPKSDQSIGDASEFTFYSALENIDFEIGEGNPAAVAIRFNVAQHSFLRYSNFHLGSARAAIEQVGNQASDLHIEGGQYGIITGKTSPAWQFLLMDSSFDGQSVAAIHTQEAGFTLIRDSFQRTPIAIEIPDDEVEQLYAHDLRLHEITGTAFHFGDLRNPRSEITLENVLCDHVKNFAEGLEQIPGDYHLLAAPLYIEKRFSAGVTIGPDGREDGITLTHKEERISHIPAATLSDIPALPSMSEWANARTLGARGDGAADDTVALQQAIDSHRVVYLPSGFYRLSGALHLRADSVLIGLHPFATQLILRDHDEHFQGDGAAIPLLIAPRNGRTIVNSIGIATGNGNPRAAGTEWLAGEDSLLDDISYIRWRSEYVAALEPAVAKPNFQPGTARPQVDLDAQYASLWIHDGGGGIVRGVWSHAGTAKAGLLVEQTTTPGVIYQFSCEHHMRNEAHFSHAANWRIYALQTEEEKPEGAEADALEIDASHNLLFANTYMYRVSRNVMPKLSAIVTNGSSEINFDNLKIFSQTRLAFDNAFLDATTHVAIRNHDFQHFEVTADLHAGQPLATPAVFASTARLEKVATGYSNASGLTTDSAGRVYFSDAANHAIYRYDPANGKAQLLARSDASAMNLAFVAHSTLLAINAEKSVSQIDISTGAIAPVNEAESAKPGTTFLLPLGLHNELIQLRWMLTGKGYVYRQGSNTARRSDLIPEHRGYFYAPDTSTAIMAGGTWRPLLQSSQMAPFAAGQSRYITSEDDARTWLATLTAPDTLNTQLFAERGGTSVVGDTAGNVYLASSQLYIYDKNSKQIGIVEVPERPTSLCFGGVDRKMLFIAARSSIYAIETTTAGK